MKYKKILAVITALLILSGCANNTASSNASESDSALSFQSDLESADNNVMSSVESEEISPESREQSYSSSPTSEPTMLCGLAGDTIMISDITSVDNGSGTQGSAELYSDEAFENGFMNVMCNGFAYLAESSQPCFNSIDNADVFNAESGEFEGTSNESMRNYKRVSVGDTIGGMTVTNAECSFASASMLLEKEDAFALKDEYPEIFFSASRVELSGELTLKGYICAVVEDEYGVAAGDIIFVPSGSCPIPVMSYSYEDDMKGICHKMRSSVHGDLYWENEYGNMVLGNINDLSCDTSAIPGDGTFAGVTITIDGVELSGTVSWFDHINANITSIN